jgi:hypothetical protein
MRRLESFSTASTTVRPSLAAEACCSCCTSSSLSSFTTTMRRGSGELNAFCRCFMPEGDPNLMTRGSDLAAAQVWSRSGVSSPSYRGTSPSPFLCITTTGEAQSEVHCSSSERSVTYAQSMSLRSWSATWAKAWKWGPSLESRYASTRTSA